MASPEPPPPRTSAAPPPRRRPRRWAWLLLGVALAVAGAVAAAPPVAGWYLRERLLPRIARARGLTLDVDRLAVGYTSVRVGRLAIRGRGEARPFAVVEGLVLPFEPLAILSRELRLGRGRIRRLVLDVVRRADGSTNLGRLLDRRAPAAATAPSRRWRLHPGPLEIADGRLSVTDARRRLGLSAARLHGLLQPGAASELDLLGVTLALPLLREDVTVARLAVEGPLTRGMGALPRIALAGGAIQPLPRLRLTGITGAVGPGRLGGRVPIRLQGSYGGATATLWSAGGWVTPLARRGRLRIEAARFRLDRVASILRRTPVIRPRRASLDGRVQLGLEGGTLTVKGGLGVRGLWLFHPGLARVPVGEIAARVALDASLHTAEGRLDLRRLALSTGGATFSLSGSVARLGGRPVIDLRAAVPAIPCQRVLEAIPHGLVPGLRGFALRGTFHLDLAGHVDLAEPEKLTLGGTVATRRCRVARAPAAMGAERLQGPFTHTVEPRPGVRRSFVVGPENPLFAPLGEVSPYVVAALLTTEDGAFFRHKGFIPSQFRAALARNLARGGFRLGASTITMQMVKNVLLTPEKTLSRKLQELFLTWYLEQELSKERILEIYLNVIELGVDVYGVGAASRHYFGKPPGALSPLEAAFFATLLPNPRGRHVHYCRGQLTPAWDRYVRRVLRRMHERGRITDEEYAAAEKEPIVFQRDKAALPERRCLEQVEVIQRAWADARRARVREAVMKAAPEKAAIYLPRASGGATASSRGAPSHR